MEALLSVAAGFPALALTYFLGRRIGVVYRKLKRWQLSASYVGGVLLGTVICYFGAVGNSTWLWVTGLCVMTGSLVGIRHGRKQADDERKAALKAEREAAERERAGGE